MTALSFVFALVAMLGVLIFVHELGHFLVAKLCGVRVLKFSLGFGNPIGFGRWRLIRRWGETEYVVAWFPLGGFVKMLGENPDEEAEAALAVDPQRAFNAKPVWQRLAIVFAGPAMNLLLPVVIFTGALAVGMPRPAPVIGTVEPASPASEVGLRAGDRVLSVDGRPVTWWEDAKEAVRAHAGETLVLRVDRDGEEREFVLPVRARAGLDAFGGVAETGWAGLSHARLPAVLGVPDAGSPASSAGLRSGDRVLEVDGTPVKDWPSVSAAYAGAAGERVVFAVERDAGETSQRVDVAVPGLGSTEALGVVPASVLIAQVTPESPAERAGLAPGDLIVAVDGDPIGSFASFAEIVRTSEGRALHLVYARDGERREVDIRPQLLEADSGLGIPEERYLIGITAETPALPGARALDRERNPLVALPRATIMTGEVVHTFLVGLQKLVTGQVSRKQLAGPIGIAEIAHRSLQRGWEAYVSTLILISINLGILNLLPIPVLDGGQAVLLMIEGVKRSPVSLRTREIAQQIGLTVLVLLMGLAFWNDLSRHWSRLVDWLRQGSGL